jgi:cytochrome c oxidase assembly protein subunit 15
MLHRYLATGVGVLITILTVAAWRMRSSTRQAAISPWWPTLTLLWVCIQGAFGALTVTMKLFPAIVTLHLLGAYLLLALLMVQATWMHRNHHALLAKPFSRALRLALAGAFGLLLLQSASGAWVSTQYAVLACTEFPRCQGSWWPAMDFAQAFDLWHPLGIDSQGQAMSFQALTAIHYTHRALAMLTLLCLGALAYYLMKHEKTLLLPARYLLALLVLQGLTGLSNVVLGWPMVAAILHTGGAGAMVVVLVWMLTLTTPVRATTLQ